MELIYARWLAVCARAALALLITSFAAYVTGLLPPLIPLELLPSVWGLGLERFLAAAGAPAGWGWLGVVTTGDYANLAGVALLGAVTIVCYARLLVALLAARERPLAWLAAAQIAVLIVAASGLLTGTH